MIISRRSKLCLAGSTFEPIAIVIVRYQFLDAREGAKNAGRVLLDFHPGLVYDGMFAVGILCLASALISLLVDFLLTRRTQ